jgi:hypothetical protein
MSSNVLGQAREKVGGSKLELEGVYRRRARDRLGVASLLASRRS